MRENEESVDSDSAYDEVVMDSDSAYDEVVMVIIGVALKVRFHVGLVSGLR